VVVPRLTAQKQLHKPDTTLHQTPGEQTAGTVFASRILIEAIHSLRCLGFLRQIECFRCRHLHPRCQLISCYASLKIRFTGELPLMQAIQTAQQIQILTLWYSRQMSRRCEVQNSRFLRTEYRPLKHRRHPATRPVQHAIHRVTTRICKHHVGRQILILGAQCISDPAAQ